MALPRLIDSGDVEKKAAREINQRIRVLGIDLAELGDDSPVEFLCECGCMGRVALTPDEYDAAGGALIEGHEATPIRNSHV